MGELNVDDINSPAIGVPAVAVVGEFFGDYAVVGAGGCYANSGKYGFAIGEDDVSKGDLAHVVIEDVSVAILSTLWRPHIAPTHLLGVGLILIYPPVSHGRLFVNSFVDEREFG